MFHNSINKKMKQITNTILMIEPTMFRYNEQAIVNNYYQQILDELSPDQTRKSLSEFNDFVDILRKGINVIVVKDTINPDTPDSIFPNGGFFFMKVEMLVCTQCAENEETKGEDILDILVDDYKYK